MERFIEVGDIGFVYPNVENIFSCFISYFSKGLYSHCFQVIDKSPILVGESHFPNGIRIIRIEDAVRNRSVDFYRIKGLKKRQMKEIINWWQENRGKSYDLLYYVGYILKKVKIINNRLAYTCNEAVYYACKSAGIIFKKWDSPSSLSKNEKLEYIFTKIF